MAIIVRSVITSSFLSLCLAIGGGFAAFLPAGEAPPGNGNPPQNDTKKRLNNTTCTCDSVTVIVKTEPTSPLARPAPGDLGADAPPSIDRAIGMVVYGGTNGGRQGLRPPADVTPNVHKWILTVNGTDNVCCAKVRVGLIQNLMTNSTVYTYEGGATTTITAINPSTGMPISGPINDSASLQDHPYYSPKAKKNATACGQDLELEMSDFPSGSTHMERNGRWLRNITSTNTFRIWLVKECPPGTHTTLRYYDWKVNFSYNFTGSGDGFQLTPPTSGTGESTGGGNVPPGTDPNPNPNVAFPLANTALNQPGSPVHQGFP